MSSSKPTISIIIKTYDDRVVRPKDASLPPLNAVLTATLEALCRQTVAPNEIIVVDSSAGDGIEQVINEFVATTCMDEQIALIHVPLAPEDFTYTHALNVGVSEARGDLLVSLSGDATPANSTWLEELIAPFIDENVAGTYSRHVVRPGMRISIAERLRLWWRYRSRKTTVHQRNHVFSNASSCVRSELLESFPFDETLVELEDYAWAKTIQDAGYKIVYAGRSEVLHSHDSKMLKTLQRMIYYFWLRLKTDTE